MLSVTVAQAAQAELEAQVLLSVTAAQAAEAELEAQAAVALAELPVPVAQAVLVQQVEITMAYLEMLAVAQAQ